MFKKNILTEDLFNANGDTKVSNETLNESIETIIEESEDEEQTIEEETMVEETNVDKSIEMNEESTNENNVEEQSIGEFFDLSDDMIESNDVFDNNENSGKTETNILNNKQTSKHKKLGNQRTIGFSDEVYYYNDMK